MTAPTTIYVVVTATGIPRGAPWRDRDSAVRDASVLDALARGKAYENDAPHFVATYALTPEATQ